MQSKHESKTVGREPVGNICVLRAEDLNGWSVIICKGARSNRTPLKTFSTRGEAEDFAKAELAKLNSIPGAKKKYVLHVDDCPCWQKEL